jgi:hypothetical protein
MRKTLSHRIGFISKLTFIACSVFTFATAIIAQSVPSPVMKLVVDETQAPCKIAFVHEEIRVTPGAIALAYPKWIPGEHGPTGPIQQLAVLKIHAGNTVLSWTRDPEEINTIHVNIPAGVSVINVDFDTLVENTISSHQLLLAWNTTVLYPLGIDKTKLMIQPSLLLPKNWKQASSMSVTGQSDNRVNFAPISLERLIDSPVLAGEFLRALPLNSGWPAELDVTGDTQAAVDSVDDAHAARRSGSRNVRIQALGKTTPADITKFGAALRRAGTRGFTILRRGRCCAFAKGSIGEVWLGTASA